MTLRTFSTLLIFLTLGGGSLLWSQQAQVNLDFDPQSNSEGLNPYGASVVSPEVLDDRRVTFRLQAPNADEVLLTRGPLTTALGVTEAIPFSKDKDGLWTLTVGPVPANIYVYKLRIDGVTVADPNNTIAGTNVQPPYSVLVVHGARPAYYDAKNVRHGTVTRHIYHSDTLGGERELFVYAPPGYNSTQKYPTLYLTGGSGEDAGGWLRDGRANFIMDNLLADGRALPMLIAFPNNQVIHRSRPDHAEHTFDLFEADLRENVIPLVDSHYSTIATADGRALAGLSMGGRHAMVIGFRSFDLFSSFGVLSAGDVDAETSLQSFLSDPQTNDKIEYLFVGQGTHEDRPGSRTNVFHEVLMKHNIDHEYYVGGGGAHDWATWRHLLYERFLRNLWRKN